MSVDVVAELPSPVSLATVLKGAGDVLRALLGPGAEPPELEIVDGWQVESHLRVASGRPLSAEDRAGTMIGGRIPPGEGEVAGSVTFEVGLLGGRDRASVLVVDWPGEHDTGPGVEAIVSPTRTCVGVVLATAVALSAAAASGGEFVDLEIMMLDGVAWDPARFVELARLTDAVGGFDARCEQFMRQFTRLDGWPRDRSTGSAP
ncbi:hypothetical protein [Streptomyces sp. NBC_01198]|uniref:hypothetical protein n=1 Tax=Streptomyces sp. NBC_01198 TaxID=2903769 RepID=UPI002E10E7AC|nr:hypothetical protein OG702_03435 [Streptomyces sp. NBC_01198]